MDWSDVGTWLKTNAGSGVALVGSLLTGNVPAAVAAGVSLVSSATGSTEPGAVLEALQSDPQTVVRLRELAVQAETSIRSHIEVMTRLQLEDEQASQRETQTTVRAGDVAEDRFVRWTRPGQSWLSLLAAFAYVFKATVISVEVLGLLLTLPWAYAGLREFGKGLGTWTAAKTAAIKS